jgi:endonuclease III
LVRGVTVELASMNGVNPKVANLKSGKILQRGGTAVDSNIIASATIGKDANCPAVTAAQVDRRDRS